MLEWMSRKLRPYDASIFDTISAMARERGCVNLGQGFPDFDGPDLVKEAAVRAIREGHNQYAPMAGVPALTAALRDKYIETTGIHFDPATEITVMCGATESMYASVSAICESGDEFIIFEPSYSTYAPCVRMNGGVVVPVPLEPPLFRFDPDRLRAAFGPKTKAVIINTPHNPTGTVFNRAELALIRDLCVGHDCMAITDEVYEYLVFDDHHHISLVSLDGMRERTITISSTAKTFSLTGWKIGYAVAPPKASLAIRRMHQFVNFAIATPFQHAMAAAIENRHHLTPPLTRDLQAKRDFICRELEAAGMPPYVPEGTFFVLAEFRRYSQKDDVDYVLELINSEARLATIPISVFYTDRSQAPKNYIRFCFAKRDETLTSGMARLKKISG